MSNGHPYAMNGGPVEAGYGGSYSGAGPSRTSPTASYDPNAPNVPVIPGPPQLRKRTSSLQAGVPGRELDPNDGFFGDVARWRDEQSNIGQRTSSRMIPPGRWTGSPASSTSPASDHSSQVPHPYAAGAGGPLSGPGPFARASGRPNVNITPRKSSVPLGNRGSPNTPPPSTALPPIPLAYTSSPLAGPGPSTMAAQDWAKHQRQASLASYRSSVSRNSVSPPGSPTDSISPPSISARTSSLASSPTQDFSALPTPLEQSRQGSNGSIGPEAAAKMPSRQLLQSALDLAQRAVEMDRNNDNHGALEAYQEAVTRLRLVMERVGVEPSRNAKGKGTGKGSAEDEGRTLRGIHDAYVQRIQLLLGPGQDPDGTIREGDIAEESPAQAEPVASRSTATLVPSKRPTVPPTEDRTPRPSLDHVPSDKMAQMAISSTPSAAAPTPPSPSAASVPALGRPISGQQDPADAPSPRHSSGPLEVSFGSPPTSVSLQQALDNVTVQTPDFTVPRQPSISHPHDAGSALAQALPIPDATSPTLPLTPPSASSTTMPISPASAASPSRIQRLRSRPLGIDQEAGLPDEETGAPATNGDAESLNRTPQPLARAAFADQEGRGSMDNKALPALPPSSSSRSLRKPIPSFDYSADRGAGLVSASTSLGTISQRRLSRNLPQSAHTTPDLDAAGGFDARAGGAGAVVFPSSASIGAISHQADQPRLRTQSQPQDQRPDFSGAPPVPSGPRKKASLTFPRGLRISVNRDQGLMPPASIASAAPRSSNRISGIAGSLISPLPEAQPNEVLHRPFHILRIIHRSMDDTSPGVYLTGAIHISSSVWRPSSWSSAAAKGTKGNPPPKILAQDVKFRVIHQLLLHLTIIKSAGGPLLDGLREFRFAEPGASPAVPTMPAEHVARLARDFEGALEGLEEEMEGAYKLLTKAGVGVGSWKGKGKKAGNTGGGGWGNSLKNKVGGMSKEKVMDSPDKYVDVLETLCAAIQVLDHHLLCVTGPCTPAYHIMQPAQFHSLEARLTRCAEFVGAVVVPFVLDDLKQFFLRYLKGGVRYLED